jgi:hypothetical protein
MSFWRRKKPDQPEHDVTHLDNIVALPDGGRLKVVGESFRQPALKKITHGVQLAQVTGDNWDESVAMPVTLRPEPTNPYDSDAVRVEINGEHVGYLSSDDAPDYQPLLLHLEQQGKLASCPGRLMIAPSGDICVYLHIAPAEEISFLLSAPDGTTPLPPAIPTTVTGEENYQDELEPIAQQLGATPHATVASLGFCTIQQGKYAGERAIEVRVNGSTVGQLTRAKSHQYEHLVDAAIGSGRTPICRAYVHRSADRGVQVQVMLPRMG